MVSFRTSHSITELQRYRLKMLSELSRTDRNRKTYPEAKLFSSHEIISYI